MNKGLLGLAGGTAALCGVLAAAPAFTATHRPEQQVTVDQQKVTVDGPQEVTVDGPVVTRDFNFAFGDEGGSWLGVETGEVNGAKAKELKLPAERGALIGKVAPDSPASKAGLEENDVVTEMNGQPVEGALQFRRMIRETPAGRTVQLKVWRSGHNETLSATLGKSEDGPTVLSGRRLGRSGGPSTFAFRMPDLPEVPDMPEVMEIPDIPSMDMEGNAIFVGRPRLGIDAEDLNGQLGSFFGAPEGEGILVRSVNSGSPAEKAGLKAGDVITSVDGERIRSTGDLQQKLAIGRTKEKDKDKAKEPGKDEGGPTRVVKLGVLRNKSEVSLSVELPEPHVSRSTKIISHRTNI